MYVMWMRSGLEGVVESRESLDTACLFSGTSDIHLAMGLYDTIEKELGIGIINKQIRVTNFEPLFNILFTLLRCDVIFQRDI